MSVFLILKSILLIAGLGLALFHDIKEQKIKNFITLPAAFLGLVLNFLEQGPCGLLVSLKGWIIPVLLLIVLYRINVMGAGDIKLFAAIGAVMGLPFVLYSFVFTIYIGGVVAVIILIKRNQLLNRMKRLSGYVKFVLFTRQLSAYSSKDDSSSKFIFSTAIVPGTLLQLCLTVLRLKGVTV